MLLSLSSVTNLSLLFGFCAACTMSYRCIQLNWWAAVTVIAIPSQPAPSISRDYWIYFDSSSTWKSSKDSEFWEKSSKNRDFFLEQIWSCDQRQQESKWDRMGQNPGRGLGQSLQWSRYECKFPAKICPNRKPIHQIDWLSKLYGLMRTFFRPFFILHPPWAWSLPFRWTGISQKGQASTFPRIGPWNNCVTFSTRLLHHPGRLNLGLTCHRPVCGVLTNSTRCLFDGSKPLSETRFQRWFLCAKSDFLNSKCPIREFHAMWRERGEVDWKNPPPPGGSWFPIYYVPSSRTVCKRTPLEGFVPGGGVFFRSKFLNSRLRWFNEATLLKQASKDRLFSHAAGKLWKCASKRIQISTF